MRVSPFARAPRISARWEMDLSPGTWAVPLRGPARRARERRGIGVVHQGLQKTFTAGQPVANAPLQQPLLHGKTQLGQGGSWNQTGLPQLRRAVLRPYEAADRMPEMRFQLSSPKRCSSSAAAASPSPPVPARSRAEESEDEEEDDEDEDGESESEEEEEEAEAVVEAPLNDRRHRRGRRRGRRGRRSRGGIGHDGGRRRRGKSPSRTSKSRTTRTRKTTIFWPKSKTRKTMSPASSIPASPRTKVSLQFYSGIGYQTAP